METDGLSQNEDGSRKIFKRKHMTCEESIYTWQIYAGTLQDIICIFSRNPCTALTIILHASTTSNVQDMSDFSSDTALLDVSTRASVLAAKHSALNRPTAKQRYCGSYKVVFPVKSIAENIPSTSFSCL